MSEDSVSSVVARVRRLRASVVDLAFVCTMLVFVATIAVLSFQYPPDARVFPLLVSIITLPLIGILLLWNVERVSTVNVLPARLRPEDKQSPPSEERLQSRLDTIRVIGWIVLVFGSTYLVGMELSLFLFLLAFYRYEVGLGWLRVGTLSIFIWVFVVAIFTIVLGVPMPQGLIYELLLG